VKITIINTEDQTDVRVRFGILIYFHINYEAFIRFFSLIRDEENKISIKAFFEKSKGYIESRKIVKQLVANTTIAKFKLVSKNNAYDPIIEQYINATSWIVLSFIKEYIHSNFKKVKKDEYLVVTSKKLPSKYDLDFNITAKISVYALLFVLLRNVRDIPRILKHFN